MGKSGKQVGQEHVEAVKCYLAILKEGEEGLPRLPDGRPNLSAIARSCGFTRQVWTNNAAALNLLTVHADQEGPAAEVQAGPADGRTRVTEARIAKLESSLHDTQERLEAKTAECEALREELDGRRYAEEHLGQHGQEHPTVNAPDVIRVAVRTIHCLPGGLIHGTGEEEGAARHRFVGRRGESLPRPPLIGEVWRLTGHVEDHPRYGRQLQVTGATLDAPSGVLLVAHLSTHPAYRGIGFGPAKARRLHEILGGELYRLLNGGEISRLEGVLTPTTAEKLLRAWKRTADENRVLHFLEEHGFDPALAEKVRRAWGRRVIDKLREDPYRMLAFAGWGPVDAAALAMGVSVGDRRRLVAAVEECLYRRLPSGHTLTPGPLLLADLRRLLEFPEHDAQQVIEQALGAHAIVRTGDGYQPSGVAMMERFVSDRLRGLLDRGCGELQGTLFGGPRQRREETVERHLEQYEKDSGVNLTGEQRAAVVMALNEPLSVLTGGAGTGKTTVLRAVCHCAEALLAGYKLMALSGRAAAALRRATGRHAYTIAGLLHAAAEEKVHFQTNDLLVVDEASMVDLPLMYRLLKGAPVSTSVLLVGDPHQLPPISFGMIFDPLTRSAAVPQVELTAVHRQAAATRIPQAADLVRRGIVPTLGRYQGPGIGVSFIEAATGSVPATAARLLDELGSSGTQIIGPVKGGPAGTRAVNALFHARSQPGDAPLEGWGYRAGQPVVYLVNDYSRRLYNGSIGLIREAIPARDGEEACVIVDFDGNEQTLAERDFENFDLAYAVTCHKAQGSQFQRVVVIVTPCRPMDRTWVYTAMTRAVEQIVFIGDRPAWATAIISTPMARERQVGLQI